jgi:hypothetical protein
MILLGSFDALCTEATTSRLAINIDPATQISTNPLPGQYYGGNDIPLTDTMLGWTFVLSAPATITGFGWYDQDLDGLSHPHQIGLWYGNASTNIESTPYGTNTTLRAMATVPAGTNAVLEGSWRRVDLATPIDLPSGYYILAGTFYVDDPDVNKWMMGPGPSGPTLPGDPRVRSGLATASGPPDPFNPNTNLFQLPNGFLTGWTVAFGPNLFIVPPGVPVLHIAASPNQTVLHWPAWGTNFILESRSALDNGSWTAVVNSTTAVGDSLFATNVVGSTAVFYRLRGR